MGQKLGKRRQREDISVVKKDDKEHITAFRRLLPRGFDHSYGAMAVIMGYLPLI